MAFIPAPVEDPRAACPVPVRRPCMIHEWNELTFLHWRYEPDVVARLLPPGLEVETFDGSAWVGLVPFQMLVRPPGLPPLPWVSHFPETNVRTYARAADGSVGVWFLSLDAARLHAVLGGRIGYRLPYFWSQMSIVSAGDVRAYRCERRWPEPTPARSEVVVRVGDPFAPDELGDLDHWLTARWLLYSRFPGRLWFARADHCVWPLQHAEVLHLDDGLVEAAGLPAPEGPPLVPHSPGVEVRIGLPWRLPRL
ncbi:MAG: DUF2071 domain-containing protein [Acidimicrobiales bacterium]|nr:DUF2071 domain-containing protein [Acidimicrobiales bacterium]